MMIWLLYTIITSSICVIIALCGNFKLYKSRNDMFMQKRKMVFGLNAALIIGILSSVGSQYGIMSSNETIFMLSIVLFFAVWFFLFYALNVKTFMLCFKTKWNFYRLEAEWQKIINPNYGETIFKKNWYIRNNKIFGNFSFIQKLFGITHFIGFCICFFGEWQSVISDNIKTPQLFGILLIIIFLLPVLLYIVVLYSIDVPVIDDIFYINWGSKIHAKISILLVINYVIQNILLTMIKPIPLIPVIIILSIRSILLFAMVSVSTFMLMYNNTNDDQMETQLKLQESRSEIDLSKNINITLKDILSNKYSIHLFMIHLFQEFSMECLVSYIELTQFQKYLLTKMDDKSQMNDIELIDFPENIPISSIVENDETAARDDNDGPVAIKSAKLKAHNLYNKYIKEGCEHEINISGSMRDQLRDILDDKNSLLEYNADLKINMNDLVNLFNAAKDEMFRLMEYSLLRFKNQSEYLKIIQIFAKIYSNKSKRTISLTDIFILK